MNAFMSISPGSSVPPSSPPSPSNLESGLDLPSPRPRRRLARVVRYQLRKEAVGLVLRNAPWIFRDHLSTAAQVFEDGQWLRLLDGSNRVVGYGMYEAHGAIAIRVLRRGMIAPDAAWLASMVDAALARRAALRSSTDAFRAVHGECDGLAAVVVDVFGSTVVVQSYSAGADALARLAGRMVARQLGATAIVLKPVQRRQETAEHGRVAPRWLRGSDGDLALGVSFHETSVHGAIALSCDPFGGQKSGAYLDLRGLRRAVSAMDLSSARVLNLFAYTGMLGRCAERAGAREIWQVDSSSTALEFAISRHVDDGTRHRMIVADVFEWLPKLPVDQGFALVVVDPPAMTSRRVQVPGALASYRRLYRAAAPHVAPGGTLIAACCTSRITRAEFKKTVAEALGGSFELISELSPEIDHPVTFVEADYLKILCWRRRTPPP
jgi:23S rRNA (cytosine1962-C5)-methyltransferase